MQPLRQPNKPADSLTCCLREAEADLLDVKNLSAPPTTLAQVRHERGWNWPKWFRISSGNGRVCTTFALKSKMFRQVDSELAE